jgi:hypothetical protein
VIGALATGVHHFYDFAPARLVCSPLCLTFWLLLLVVVALVSTPVSRILILLR